MCLSQLRATVLGGGLSDALLESRIECRIRIKPDFERDIQYRIVLTITFGQQVLGVINAKLIQVVEKTHPKPGIDNLRQVVDRTSHRFGKSWQRQIRMQVGLLRPHDEFKPVFVLKQLIVT